MSATFAIAERELRAYFSSPVAFIVAAVFLAVSGFFFASLVYVTQEASLRSLFNNVSVVMLFVAPALTMRLLAEEQRSGTMELVLTNPVREVELVLGKYLASLAIFSTLLVFTLYYALLLFTFGNPDQGPLLSGYLGIFLAGAAFLAVGLLASSFTQNQIVAAVVSFGALLILFLADLLSSSIAGPLRPVFSYLSILSHLNDPIRGVIATSDIVYFLSVTAGALFLSVLALQTRKLR